MEHAPVTASPPNPHDAGIKVAASRATAASLAASEIAQALGAANGAASEPPGFAHILVFYSTGHDAADLAAHLTAAFPGVPVSGCSTAGEIAPSGIIDGGVVAIAFPAAHFRVHAGLVEGVGASAVERASDAVRELRSKLRLDGITQSSERVFALLLVDGLSNSEEMVVAAVHWAVDNVQLIGGSAGDGLAFDRTSLIHDGQVVRDAAVLIMVETSIPFRVFKTQNFEPTTKKLVVTAADTEKRIVYELNAEPAAREYAAAIGLLPDDLGPFSFASHPLVVKIGGDYYCRSIRNMNADGSLTFFCAIDEGLVFTIAQAQDILSSTAKTLSDVSESLGGISMVLGFDCVLRRLDAENRQIRHDVEALYRLHNVCGFQTYGEQFNAMHLNQTLTGIAFGVVPREQGGDGSA